MRVQPKQKLDNFLRKEMTQLTNMIRQTIHSKRKPPHMETNTKKIIMNMPFSLFSHLHQKIVFDTYLVYQSLQIIVFNAPCSSKDSWCLASKFTVICRKPDTSNILIFVLAWISSKKKMTRIIRAFWFVIGMKDWLTLKYDRQLLKTIWAWLKEAPTRSNL